MVDEARASEMPLPAIDNPFAGQLMRLTLLLKIVQSTPVRAPVVVELAFQIENTQLVLL